MIDAQSSNILVDEVRQWNSPAVGAYLLWQFTVGYRSKHKHADAPPGLLQFVAAAILTNRDLCETISNRREHLQSYAKGFEDMGRMDLLVGLQSRVRRRMSYTWSALDIAVASGLLVWDTDTGKLWPAETPATKRGQSVRPEVRKLGDRAVILGGWFAKHDLGAIASYLKLEF